MYPSQSHSSKYASSVTSLSEQRRGSIHQSGLPETGVNQQALRDSILGEILYMGKVDIVKLRV